MPNLLMVGRGVLTVLGDMKVPVIEDDTVDAISLGLGGWWGIEPNMTQQNELFFITNYCSVTIHITTLLSILL